MGHLVGAEREDAGGKKEIGLVKDAEEGKEGTNHAVFRERRSLGYVEEGGASRRSTRRKTV